MSTLSVDTIEDRSAAESVDATYLVHGSAKAWANFNGTGTVATRDTFNMSSLVDNGTGDYTINLTNDAANNDYACSVSANNDAGAVDRQGQPYAYLVGSISMETKIGNTGTLTDADTVCPVIVTGDMA